MTAKVYVPTYYDLQAIARAAGSSGGDAVYYEEGALHVKDVSQASLDAALAAYDHRATIRAHKIAEAKAEAQRRILGRYPQWKQANMHARTTELIAFESGHYRDSTGALQPARALTADEQAELAAIVGAWQWIKAVRMASDQIEADIRAAADPSAIDVVNDPRWPA